MVRFHFNLSQDFDFLHLPCDTTELESEVTSTDFNGILRFEFLKERQEKVTKQQKLKTTAYNKYNHPHNIIITMVDVNPETGEALPRTMIGNKSPRFTLWLAFFAFSTITMVRTRSIYLFLN